MSKTTIAVLSLVLFFGACTENKKYQTNLEKFAELPLGVGNIAYADNGDLVYSNHPFYNPQNKVMRYDIKSKTASPFPNVEWNIENKNEDCFLSAVLGIRNDNKGVVWMLDMGFRNHIIPKLVGWDTKNNKLFKVIKIPAPASLTSSQLNDFVIDTTHGVFIIADEQIGPQGDGKHAALVLVNMKTNKSKRLLEGHYSVVPENKAIVFKNNNSTQQLNIPGTTQPLLVGADGITLDKHNEWLYYAPLNGTKLYRIKVSDLVDSSLDASTLAQKVECYSNKENNGGLSIDRDNNIYFTNLEQNGISVIDAKDKKIHLYTQDNNLIWPDGISYHNDGYMYVSAAQLQLASVFNNGINKTSPPFYIYRFKPITEGLIGR